MPNEKDQPGIFKGLNISSLEKDMALVLPKIGESKGKEENENPDDNQQDKSTTHKPNTGTPEGKIWVPDTAEEIKAAMGEGSNTGDESHEEENTTKGKGGEDAIIKEDSPLYLHAATLHEEGILPTLNLNDLKGKPFSEAMKLFLSAQKEYIEKGRSEYLDSLTDRQREFLEMIELGVPQENVEHQFTIEDAYSKVTDQVLSDDTEMQKQIIVQDLKLKGLSDTKIQVFLKASEDNETLFEEAKEARDNINTYIAGQKQAQIETAKAAQKKADDEEAELQKNIKATIEKTEEILPGIKLTPNEKIKLNDLMTKPVEEKVINGRKTPINLINKKRMEDRVLFDLKLNYFIQMGLFDAKADLSKFVKKMTSTAAEKLSGKLKEEVTGVTGKGITYEKKEEQVKKVPFQFPQLM
jgi:hypothetical protein